MSVAIHSFIKTPQVMKHIIVVHYAEIAIKGNNRKYFEKQLVTNIKRALPSGVYSQIRRLRGRIVIFLNSDFDAANFVKPLQSVFGVSHFSLGCIVEKQLSLINDEAWRQISQIKFDSFCVRTKRAYKQFSITSVEMNRQVGSHLFDKCAKRVDLSTPDVTVYIEIVELGALIYTQKISGAKGMPVGVSERAVSLLSSGIDSPVASYLMLKRGIDLIYVHFHSQPYTNIASQENTERIVKVLAQSQYYSKIYFVPFVDIQKEIMAHASAELRVLLYRRYMIRLAEQIGIKERCRALVTGESVGQVASQTLSNIQAVSQIARLPILRPLCGADKEEIVQQARKIGTYEISTEPYEDCCSLFVPDNPATKVHPDRLNSAERNLDMEALLTAAFEQTVFKEIRYSRDRGESIFLSEEVGK